MFDKNEDANFINFRIECILSLILHKDTDTIEAYSDNFFFLTKKNIMPICIKEDKSFNLNFDYLIFLLNILNRPTMISAYLQIISNEVLQNERKNFEATLNADLKSLLEENSKTIFLINDFDRNFYGFSIYSGQILIQSFWYEEMSTSGGNFIKFKVYLAAITITLLNEIYIIYLKKF